MSSSLGQLFRVTTFGESHGTGVGAVVDGCPAGLRLEAGEIQAQLDRRRPGQSEFTTPRAEPDRVEILSGVDGGTTLGTPIALLVRNQDMRPEDYAVQHMTPRPSHADYTYFRKYGVNARSGGGRSSARETVGRVAAGAIAQKVLRERWGVEIVAWVHAVGDITSGSVNIETVSSAEVDATPVRCPDRDAAERMQECIRAALSEGDSIGGIVRCIARGVPPGWGDPVFDKLQALLAQAVLSLPACKGFEFGSGFAGTRMRGAQHNDPFVSKPGGGLRTATNHSGGIQGGISNGEFIDFKAAFKPVATIGRPQSTVDFDGRPVTLQARGRHDPCVLPRAVPVVEAMAALVLCDSGLRAELNTGS